MEEAKFSFNIKFRLRGFDCQFTLRSDEEQGYQLVNKALIVLEYLQKDGAVPTSNHQASLPLDQGKRVCPECGQSDELELIEWEKDGKPRKAWKCQRCKKWLPKNSS